MLNCPYCDTRDFTRCLGWPDSARRFQQDAADFIRKLICHMQEKLLRKATFLRDLFWSELRDGQSSLMLELPPTSSGESDVGDLFTSNGYRVATFARVLMVHLSDTKEPLSRRLDEWPLTLNLSRYNGPLYSLHGAILHLGNSSNANHYTAAIRPSLLEHWILCADRDVSLHNLSDMKDFPTVLLYVADDARDKLFEAKTRPNVINELPKRPESQSRVKIIFPEDVEAEFGSLRPNLSNVRPSREINLREGFSGNELYREVAKQLAQDPNSFRLRLTSAGGNLSSSVARCTSSGELLIKTASGPCVYFEEGPEMETLHVPHILAYFNPGARPVTMKLRGLFQVCSLQGLRNAAAQALRCRHPETLQFFQGSNRLQRLPQCGDLLICQDLSLNREFDPSVDDGFVSFYELLGTALNRVTPAHEYSRYLEMDDAMRVTFTPFSDSGCRFRVKIPRANPELTGELLRRMVLLQNRRRLAPGETVRLYDCLRPMSPSTKELSGGPLQRSETALGAFEIYYRFGNSNLIPVRVMTSDDGISVAELREEDAMNGTRLRDVAERAGIDVTRV
jgi:hypothetical protein